MSKRRTLPMRVADLRRRKKLSLRQVAELSGISHVTVFEIERGTQQPTLATVQALARGLGVRVVDLLPSAA